MTLVPLVIMSFYILTDFPVLKKQIDNSTGSLQYESNTSFQKVKEIAIKNSEETLDAQSDKLIRIRLIEISKQISEFLRSTQADAIFLSTLPQDEQTYLGFVNAKRKSVWFNRDNYVMLPLYSELSFIGTDGVERIKIQNGSIRKDFVDLGNDMNLEFKARAAPGVQVTNYFKEGMKLKKGEIYVSHIEGRILNITEAHAGNKNPSGKYAHGVQRFVTPVYRDGEKIGILMLGLDSIHILEYMQHIRPLDYERLPLTDLISGDYLALLDNEGWLLHPKQYFSKGYDKNGEFVPPVNDSNFAEYNSNGLMPMHIPSSKILWGKSGDEYMKRIMNSLYVTGEGDFFSEQTIEGKTKVALWVPVTYGREYGDRAVNMEHGYGFLFASSELPIFYQSSSELGNLISNESEILSKNLKEAAGLITGNIDESSRHILNKIPFILMLIIVMLVGFGIAGTYLIIRPLRSMTEGARILGEGKLDHRIDVTSGDEMGELATSFNIMASELEEKAVSMRKKTRELSALYAVAKSVSQSLDMDEMLNSTLLNVLQIMGAEGGGINLTEDDGTILHLKAHKGLSQKFVDAVKTIKIDFGASGRAVKMRIPVALDISRYPEGSLIPLLREIGVISIASTPILFKDKILGTINIHYMHPHTLSQDELDLFASIGNELGVAVENLNLFSELARHDRTLEALYTIDRVISQTLDMEIIFRDALSKTLDVTKTEGGGIYILEPDGKTLSLKKHQGISPELAQAFSTIMVGKGVSGMAVSSGKTVILDVRKYPDPEQLSLLVKDGILSIISTPLVAKGKAVGALTIINRRFRSFSQEDLDLLDSIGSQIGGAVENAMLYGELERHHRMLNTLYSIESVVSRSLNLEEIFNTALLKALEVTDTEAGTLYSVDGDILRLEACEGLCPEFKKEAVIRNVGDGIPGMAAQLKKAISMDISEFPSPPLLPYMTKEGLVSFIGTPLLSKGKVVGALALGSKKKRIFTQDDLDLLLSIGNVIGIAVENAVLYSKSKENLEKLQKAYEELQTLDKMKDEFMSNVSHELKTPLISIKGYGELLYDEKLGGRLDEQKKSLEAIIRNADRLTRLINSILFITRFQTGKIEFRSEPIQVDEIVQICVEDLKNPMDRKRIIFEKEVSGVSRLRGDKDRFVEVISNLLDNAIKFTRVGGKIVIKAWNQAENVHITVTDNGIGIPENIIPKLFTRFYQVDASTSRKYGGTGLGLYITKTIVDASGGKIWIESEVGKGTTVHLLIPSAKEEH
ncbi:MAG: GAF domain-containing protein [Candidatus Methanoperedens sp.]|nr:GAF domain-containing protein [Candidatus Methanoperedens sp.]